MKGAAQTTLFDVPRAELDATSPNAEHQAIAARLPQRVYLGTMSWSFPGWRGLVYGAGVNPKRLSADGLTAYSKHALLSAVEIDRSYYEPLPESELRAYAAQVPDGFRFVLKAHEECSVRRFPTHARYGRKRGEANGRYLDAAYATDAVVGPARAGLGDKLGTIVFQFPPQEVASPDAFAEELGEFLSKLPKGLPYAVELRNPELLTSAYSAALANTGALHCHNVWGAMPPVLEQARRIPPRARRPLVIRWLLRRGDEYEAAKSRFEPFDRIVEEDAQNRDSIAVLVSKAAQNDVVAFVLINNKAEGCAPESIVHLARAIASRYGASRSP